MSLFREEVSRGRTEHLHGSISLALPLSWQTVTGALVLMVASIGLFLASATYTRTETAQGSIVPEGGILKVVPARAGRVEAVDVREGASVHRGQTLAWISVEEVDQQGLGAQAAVLRAIADQRASLERQRNSEHQASESQQKEYDAQIVGLREEVASIDVQVSAQSSLVMMAEEDLRQAAEIAKRGFVSRRELSEREETLLSRKQQLSALLQARSAKRASITQAVSARAQASARGAVVSATIAGDSAVTDRERATAAALRGYALVASEDGKIAAMSLYPGDTVTTENVAMLIVPKKGRLVARLYIPIKASGFVRAGQNVRLALDSYPYERFGTVRAILTSVSEAPVLRSQDAGGGAFYIAMASITQPFVSAYGRSRTLLPGMTLTARIVTEQRTLVQWLFDPLYASAKA